MKRKSSKRNCKLNRLLEKKPTSVGFFFELTIGAQRNEEIRHEENYSLRTYLAA